MFNFFARNKPDIHSITFPDLGWTLEKDEDFVRVWVNPEGSMALSINYFPQKPDIPSLKDIDALRSFYRQSLLPINGGLVEVETSEIQGYAAIRTVFKIPQEPKGTTYLASLTLPFRKHSFVIKIQALETGETGMRDTLVLDRLMETGEVKFTKAGLQGWEADPYDKNYKEGSLMNLSEQEQYDTRYRSHPLSMARERMKEIQSGIQFSDVFGKLDRFS